jgi:hypothetical protein
MGSGSRAVRRSLVVCVVPPVSHRPHEERLRRNEESKTKAEHDGEPWSGEELEQLVEYWDGTEETLADIAEILGRTIEACRQRYYETRRGHIRVSIKQETTVTVRGWLVGFCFECGSFGDVYSNGTVSLCEDCR